LGPHLVGQDRSGLLTHIPFNRAYTTGREEEYIREAIANAHLSGNGPFARRCAAWLQEWSGAEHALLTPSCTSALEMAALLADIGSGDEVIMPAFTFVSTANAVVLRGGIPVFVDIRSDTLNMDETLIESAIGERTVAIMPVHYAGVGCEMDAICELARERGLGVIEDAAQGAMSTYRGRALGSFGQLGALSFHETKNVQCGEGGALLINDPELVARADVVYEKGTDRTQFFLGAVDKYTWVDLGSSYPLSEINAAFLWAQLDAAQAITELRLRIWERYHEAFAELESRERIRRPIVPPECVHNAHMYYVLLSEDISRRAFLDFLAAADINAVFHYVPLHLSAMGRRTGRPATDLPVTEFAAERLVRLPLWAGMSEKETDRVITAATAAIEHS
jgi:dTDP-4-amino-4,6-dideoxygalactose transaminase